MRLARAWPILAMGAAWHAWGAGRQVAIVLDTSTSMQSTDAPRYAIQLTKIISDLLDDGDSFTVAKLVTVSGGRAFFFRENCAEGPRADLRISMAGDRAALKSQLEATPYDTDVNAFAAAMHTARATLGGSGQRMMLFIADAGGLAACEEPLTEELKQLRASGVYNASINIGNSGSFATNPGFETVLSATDSEGLIRATAQVYQRFLGAKKVQAGSVRGSVEVDVDSYVKQAFLVAASDADIRSLDSRSSNPGADAVDPNFRGGETKGRDGRTRAYRIVKLTNPKPGRWTFDAPNLRGGWMLIQDYAIAVRALSNGAVPAGGPARVEFEVYDERTGKRIIDASVTRGMSMDLTVDGQKIQLRDYGSNGDRQAGDGVLSATHTFPGKGKRTAQGVLVSDTMNRNFAADLDAVDPTLRLKFQSGTKVDVGVPVEIIVRPESPFAGGAASAGPDKIVMSADGGDPVDLVRGADGNYRGKWTPSRTGAITARFTPIGGAKTESTETTIEVLGRIEFPAPVAIKIGPVKGSSQAAGTLDLSAAKVTGDVHLELLTNFSKRNAKLEIEVPGQGWIRVDNATAKFIVRAGDSRRYPMRVAAAACPASCEFTDLFQVTARAPRAAGEDRSGIPLAVEIQADPFLQCWWRTIVTVLLILFTLWVIYGYVSPYRFQPRIGVQISAEEDITAGAFYPLRSRHGKHGFYRHAQTYITLDHRLSRKPRNGLVRLRADRKQVKIQPANGSSAWRLRMDGEWEALPPRETPVRPGTLYRNDDSTVFFTIRMQ